MKISIVSLSDNACLGIYEDLSPSQEKFGGPWGWPENTVHVQIPDELVASLTDSTGILLTTSIRGQQDVEGNWSIVENV